MVSQGDNVGDPNDSEQNSERENRLPEKLPNLKSDRSLFTHIWQGGLLCLIFGIVDNIILQAMLSFQGSARVAYFAFALFVVQTIVLSVVVGLNSRKHWVWWGFFVWSLALVNLQLSLIINQADSNFSGRSGYAFTAFVYAFFAAQIGLTIFWAICCTRPRLRIRLPMAAVVLMFACHPFWGAQASYSSAQWLGLLTFFIIAATLTFGILRYFRFQLGFPAESAIQTSDGPRGQFGIKHLLAWTTIVAFLFGIGDAFGRTVGWDTIFDTAFGQTYLINSGMTLLVTINLVAVVWAVMGESGWVFFRVGVLIAFLLVVAFALQYLDCLLINKTNRSLAIGYSWRRPMSPQTQLELIRVWGIWTILNGMFLSALFTVFRFAGFRFTRSVKGRKIKA